MIEVLEEQKRIRDEQYPECEYVFFWRAEDLMLSHGGLRTAAGMPIIDFKASWKNAVTAAGFPNLLFHDLRRTAERNMTKAGIDQARRMKISGHKTASMSVRYNIIAGEDVDEDGARMNVWFQEQKKANKAQQKKKAS